MQGTGDGERRQVTVLFTDLVGFTAYSERAGEEAAYTLMRSLGALMTEVVHEQGGTVKSFTGDGIMAVFGAPVALEDAPLRACRAALQIQQRLADRTAEIEAKHGIKPQMRIGIHAGPAIVGLVESGDSTNVTALGDTVNLASRLQSLADPGTILLSEAAHRLVQGLVESEFAGEHQIKGKAEKHRVHRLTGLRSGASRFDAVLSRGLTSFVGRERELETLLRQLGGATHTKVIDIVGEPGMGKSRLLHEFRGRIGKQHAFVLSGNCSPDGQQAPFLAFIDVVRSSFRVAHGEDEAAVAEKLETGLTALGLFSTLNLGLLLNLLGLKVPAGALDGLDGTLIGLRTRDLLLQLLQARCQLSPVVLVLEDLHWIDSASAEVLATIVSTQEPLPLLVLNTRRPEYQPSWTAESNVSTLRLEPLTATDTSRIVQERLKVEALPDALAKLITEKAEGNALFAEEIASFLAERNVVRRTPSGLDYDAATVAAALPTSIRAVLTSRADRLPPADKALLQAAAVIGRRFDPDLLAVVTRRDDVRERLTQMQPLDLVYADDRAGDFAFKHALVQEALYDGLLTEARRALHLAIAREIERRNGNRLLEVVEVLAHHYRQSDKGEKAFTYLILAGEKSARVYSLDEAEQYLEQALRLSEASEGEELRKNPRFVDLLASMSQLLVNKSEFVRLTRLVDMHEQHANDFGDTPQLVAVLSNYSIATAQICDFARARAAAERALAMAERLGDDNSSVLARSSVIWAKALMADLPIAEAEQQRARLSAELQRVSDPYLHFLGALASAWDYLLRGHMDLARTQALDLEERGRRLGDPRALGASLWILGWIDVFDERYQEAFDHGDECVRVALTPLDRDVGLSVRGIGQIFRGHVYEGARSLWTLREHLVAAGQNYLVAGIDPALGIAKVLQGDFAGGIRYLSDLIQRNEAINLPLGVAWVRIYQAETYMELLAPKQLPPLRVLLRNLPFLIVTAATGRKKAMRLLTKAREYPMFTGASHFLARIDTDLGLLFKLGKQHAEAREHLERARPIAVQLNGSALLSKIDSALAELR